ncbi:MAG: hypothetical protein OXR66_05805 [Candidatus Woesearchaeota archaeon]|nr:hypothetical protein [Candidatus Woesearchaeota archaeon]
MEIEEFIEQDIPRFLDTYAAKHEEHEHPLDISSTYITRDYEKELFAALDHNDLVTAKHVLHDLKQKFDESPNGTPDKQQLKILLTDLYEKFKDHIDSINTFEKMDTEIDKLTGKPEGVLAAEQHEPDPIAAATPPHAQHAPSKIKKPVKKLAKKPVKKHVQAPPVKIDPFEQVKHILGAIEHLAGQGEYASAATTYKEMRAELQQSANIPQHIADRVTALHEQISAGLQKERAAQQREQVHDMLDHVHTLLRRDDVQTAAKAYRRVRHALLDFKNVPTSLVRRVTNTFNDIKAHMHPAAPLDNQLLLQLELYKNQIDEALQHHDIERAMKTYKKMRMIAQQITNPTRAQRVATKLVRMYAIINAIKEHRPIP